MKQNWKKFIIYFFVNGLTYGLLMYLIGSVTTLQQFLFSISIFGLFMAIFNTFVFPRINKTDKQ